MRMQNILLVGLVALAFWKSRGFAASANSNIQNSGGLYGGNALTYDFSEAISRGVAV